MTHHSERHLHTRIRILEGRLAQSRSEVAALNRQLADALKGIAPPAEPRRQPRTLMEVLCGDMNPPGKVVMVGERQIAVADLATGRVSVGSRPALFPDEYILEHPDGTREGGLHIAADLATGPDKAVEQKWPPEPDDDEAWRIADYHWHPFMGDYEKAVYVARDKDGHLHWAWPNAGFMTTLDKYHLRLGPGECECRRSNVHPGKDDEPAEAEEVP